MTIVAIFIVLLLAAFFLKTYWWQIETKWFGTEAEACVSRTEEQLQSMATRQDYTRRVYHCCYVRFLKEDGLEAEAKLVNPIPQLGKGTRVRIKYLPGKDNLALLTGIPGK